MSEVLFANSGLMDVYFYIHMHAVYILTFMVNVDSLFLETPIFTYTFIRL